LTRLQIIDIFPVSGQKSSGQMPMKKGLINKKTQLFLWPLIAVIWVLVPMATNAQDIKMIVRGDDFGMAQGSLAAFEKGFNEGILTCGSVLVQAPWFEGAAALARKNPKWCLGIHLSLVGEWIGYRWRPVFSWDKVTSLVDEDAFLFRDPDELFKRRPRPSLPRPNSQECLREKKIWDMMITVRRNDSRIRGGPGPKLKTMILSATT